MNLAKRKLHSGIIVSIVIALATVASFKGATTGEIAVVSDGKKIYNGRCSICHGVDGSGKTAEGKKLEARDLRGSHVQDQSDDKLMETLMYGMGKMPRFEKKLNPDQIQAVLAYIRKFAQKN